MDVSKYHFSDDEIAKLHDSRDNPSEYPRLVLVRPKKSTNFENQYRPEKT